MNAPVLVVDVGGSRVKLGIVSEGHLVARATCLARPSEEFAATLGEIGRELSALARQVGIAWTDCVGIGLGLPCIVDCRLGNVIASPTGKFEDAAATDLHVWARETFRLPVRADNDAHLALLGEWVYGAGQGVNNLVMVTLGTGVGCSVLLDNCPLRGQHYQAGLLGGFTVIKSGGRPCADSADGCVEAETGTWALPSIARQFPEFSSSQLAQQAVLDYEQVFRLAETGDELAKRLRDRSLDLWSDHVINLIHLFDPHRVILGGAVLRSADVVIPWIQRRVDVDAWTPWGRVEIAGARYPEDAGLLGAEVMLTRELSYL